MAASTFNWIFLAALAAATATRLWLARRQVRYVREHRDRVPDMFAAVVPPRRAPEAADYSAARAPLGIIDLLIGVAALLALTLGGALDWIALQWAKAFAPGSYAHGVALVTSVVILLSALDLPLAVYRTFVVEARFGFNRMTPGLFIADLAKQALIAALLGVPLLLLVLWLMERMGELWWLYVWLAWMSFNLLVL